MNQIKIGKFIAECRKKNNLTQMQLAEKLNITDRAISKWKNGKGMPDSSIMLDLCNELKISVNELLCGELIEMNNYNEVAEKMLLEMAQKEKMQNKKLMLYENVIGFSSAISFLILIFVTSFLVENNIAKIVLFILAFILLIIGVSFASKIENLVTYNAQDKESGYYRTEFRLNAFENNTSIHGTIGNSTVDLINYGSLNEKDKFRFYASIENEEQMKEIFKSAINVIDSSISDDEINEEINDAIKSKDNRFVLKSNIDGYIMFTKEKWEILIDSNIKFAQ